MLLYLQGKELSFTVLIHPNPLAPLCAHQVNTNRSATACAHSAVPKQNLSDELSTWARPPGEGYRYILRKCINWRRCGGQGALLHCWGGGIINWCSRCGEQDRGSSKNQKWNYHIYGPASPLLGTYQEKTIV